MANGTARGKGHTHVFHYVDNFIAVGRPQSAECMDTLAIMKATCSESGAPIKEEKSEGTATTLPFLGMELDMVKLEIRFPSDKLKRLKSLIADPIPCTRKFIQWWIQDL